MRNLLCHYVILLRWFLHANWIVNCNWTMLFWIYHFKFRLEIFDLWKVWEFYMLLRSVILAFNNINRNYSNNKFIAAKISTFYNKIFDKIRRLFLRACRWSFCSIANMTIIRFIVKFVIKISNKILFAGCIIIVNIWTLFLFRLFIAFVILRSFIVVI